MKIVLPMRCERLIKAAAAATHPHECFGVLLGESHHGQTWVDAVHVYQMCKRGKDKNGDEWVEVQGDEQEKTAEFFGDDIVGDFHSHPDEPPVFSKYDKTKGIADHVGDGDVALVVAIWPGKRRPWCYRLRGYWNDDGRIRRAIVVRG
jgi:proteasome lid subunit RPN8/RPN11